MNFFDFDFFAIFEIFGAAGGGGRRKFTPRRGRAELYARRARDAPARGVVRVRPAVRPRRASPLARAVALPGVPAQGHRRLPPRRRRAQPAASLLEDSRSLCAKALRLKK